MGAGVPFVQVPETELHITVSVAIPDHMPVRSTWAGVPANVSVMVPDVVGVAGNERVMDVEPTDPPSGTPCPVCVGAKSVPAKELPVALPWTAYVNVCGGLRVVQSLPFVPATL